MNQHRDLKQDRCDPMPHLADLAAACWLSPQPAALFERFGEGVQQALGHLLLTILVHDPSSKSLQRVYSSRPDLHPVGGSKPITESDWMMQVLHRGEPYIGRTPDDLKTVFFDYELLWSIGCGSVLNMPIVWSGKVLGALNILHETGWYDEHDLPTARVFAQLVAPAIMKI